MPCTSKNRYGAPRRRGLFRGAVGTGFAGFALLTMNFFLNRLRSNGAFIDGLPAVGLLFLRIFVCAAMVQHGWGKIQHPFTWMNAFGPGVPGFLQALAAVSEFFGGLGLLLGLLTPLVTFGLMSTMFVAVLSGAMRGAPMVSQGPGPSWESAGGYFVIALMFFLTGPGVISLDHALFGRKR